MHGRLPLLVEVSRPHTTSRLLLGHGIWQALNTANWDIRPHAAGPSPFPDLLGAIGALPAGQGVIEGNEIPYQSWAQDKQRENFENRLTRPSDRPTNEGAGDSEAKCYMPGVPRITYMPYPFQILQFADRVLPTVQEPVLDMDRRVVFCAAVDRNGYLPTHNRKFSQPQTADPVWNMAHCRNRRIFDDRVGLKAGRNTDAFLLQVYRRDMGGGNFVLMKDVSAPITVEGRHWGGLRLAYKL